MVRVPEGEVELRGRFADFISLCAAKSERLQSPSKPRPKRSPAPIGGTIPQLRTIVSDWHQDPDDPVGVLSRRIYSTDVAETVTPP
jgi:hypothetical protein